MLSNQAKPKSVREHQTHIHASIELPYFWWFVVKIRAFYNDENWFWNPHRTIEIDSWNKFPMYNILAIRIKN